MIAKSLSILDFRTCGLNISEIMKLSDETERNFFSWLRSKDIWWTQRGSNLKVITVYEKNVHIIKKTWPEVYVV